MKKNIVVNVIVILAIIVVAVCISPIELQNDTFYTIKIGEKIVQGNINTPDNFSIHEDLPYTYPHWLYDVSIYFIYNLGGYTALYISQIVLVAILGFAIYFSSSKLCNNKTIPFFITIITMAFLNPFIAVRAQTVTYILFVIAMYLIERYLKSGKKGYLLRNNFNINTSS